MEVSRPVQGRRIPLRDPAHLPHFSSVVGVSFAFFMGHSIILPSLTQYATTFHASTAQIGLIVSGFAIGRMVFNTVGGGAADRFGLRLVAAFGCLVTVGGAVLAGLSSNTDTLLVARLVQGAGSAFYLIPAYSYVAEIAADDGVGRILSLYQGTLLVGHSFGPVIGGLVAAVWGLRAPHFVFAGLVAVGLVLTLLYFPGRAAQFGSAGRRRSKTRALATVRALMASRLFAIAMAVCLVTFILRAGVRLTLLPLFAVGAFHFGEGEVGLVMTIATVCNVAIIPNAGRLLDHIGRRPVVVWSMAATAVVLAFLAATTTDWMLYFGAALLGIATGYAGAAPAAIAADVATTANRSTALGLQRMSADLGTVVGPLLVGSLLGVMTFEGVFLTCALAAGATTALSLLMGETLRAGHRLQPGDGA